jgi:hypothetical protein
VVVKSVCLFEQVVATDDTSLVSTSANVLVTVQPIRNHAPQFAQSTYTTEIIDNALPGTVAITVTVSVSFYFKHSI